MNDWMITISHGAARPSTASRVPRSPGWTLQCGECDWTDDAHYGAEAVGRIMDHLTDHHTTP